MQKSLTRIVGEGTLWFSASSIVLKVVGLATIFLILKKLSVYEYGLIELVFSVIPLFSIFLLPGLSTVVIADMGIEKSKGELGTVKALFHNFFKLQVALALVAWAVVFFGADIVANFYTGVVSELLKIVSFSFLIWPFRTMATVLFSVCFKFFNQSLLSFLEDISKLVLIFFFFFVLDLETHGVIFATVLSQVIALCILIPSMLLAYRTFSSAAINRSVGLFDLLRYHGKWSIFSTYIGTFGQNIRLWIIKFILNTEAVGLFAVAIGLLGHTTSLFPLNKVIAPILPQYVHQKERFYRLINKSIKYQFLSFLGIGVIAFVFFPPIIVWLFPNYESAMGLFRVLLLLLVPMSFDSIFVSVFFALKAQRNLFFASLYKVMLTIILLPVFIYFFGLLGVGYALTIVMVFYAAERYRRIRKLLPDFALRLQEFFKIDADDKLILSKSILFFKNRIKFWNYF